MKKFLAIIFMLAFGSFAMAEDVEKTSKAQNSIKKVSEKVEKAKANAGSKVKESKKQLTSTQQRKIAKKKASKQKKLLKQKQKRENIIQIYTKHLEYKQNQLEEFSEKQPDKNVNEQKEVIDNQKKE